MSVGIKDIARALGISTGTVDRALHAKPGVNPATRARVLSMAAELGYRPNLAARYLKSRKQLRISVHLPREIALFWDSLRESIREAAAPFAPALQVDFETYPGLGEGDIPLFEEALRDGTNGLIVTPGNPSALKPYIDDAAQRGIPVVCVVTDAPGTGRLASVSAAPFTSGAVVGEFLSRCQPGGGKAAFFTGWLSTHEHAEKLRGFESSLHSFGRSLQLGPIVEAHDDELEGYQQALGVLRAHPDLTSIYVSTVNSLPVLRAAEQEGRLPQLTVVTTDLFPELVERIRAGAIAATVYQRPVSQGRLALQTLYQFLRDGKRPPERIHVVPHLVMRSNLDLFLERLPVDPERA
jgi:LacI family transcriptional regulator, galactose operon repressor